VALLRLPVRSPSAYRAGMVITLRSGEQALKATVYAARRQRLDEVSAAEARAEGYRFPSELRELRLIPRDRLEP